MYAIIKTGGKQYRVSEGQVVRVEKLPHAVGEQVSFEDVMLLVNGEESRVGAPLIQGVRVNAEVVNQDRAKKINILKFKRRKHHMKRQGHRQYYTAVKITQIELGTAANKADIKKKAESNEE